MVLEWHDDGYIVCILHCIVLYCVFIVFFVKYRYICNVGRGSNSITLCFLPPSRQQLNLSCSFKFLLL